MTDARQILLALGEALHDNQISEDMCYGAVKSLRSVPPEHHMAALKSLLGLDEPETEEQPEDYLAVKTFDSRELHVGDEVTDGDTRFIVTNSSGRLYHLIDLDGHGYDKPNSMLGFCRTGRNFPAIPAILEELKKALTIRHGNSKISLPVIVRGDHRSN